MTLKNKQTKKQQHPSQSSPFNHRYEVSIAPWWWTLEIGMKQATNQKPSLWFVSWLSFGILFCWSKKKCRISFPLLFCLFQQKGMPIHPFPTASVASAYLRPLLPPLPPLGVLSSEVAGPASLPGTCHCFSACACSGSKGRGRGGSSRFPPAWTRRTNCKLLCLSGGSFWFKA